LRRALRNATSAETPKGDRALREAVLRFQGCLGSVPSRERRVLELRAGVGGTHTRSRADVARLTGLHRKSVARLERRGLKRLRSLADDGTCASATTASPGGLPLADLGDSAQRATAGGAPGTGVLGARATPHSAESKSSDDHQSAIQSAIERPIIHGLGHTLDLGPLLLAFALGGMLYLVGRELRRSI
jgi:Sigma-70, region 4